MSGNVCCPLAQRVEQMDTLHVARTKRRNGDVIQRSGRRAHLMIHEEVQEVLVEIGASVGVAPNVVVPPTRARVAKHGRRRR